LFKGHKARVPGSLAPRDGIFPYATAATQIKIPISVGAAGTVGFCIAPYSAATNTQVTWQQGPLASWSNGIPFFMSNN